MEILFEYLNEGHRLVVDGVPGPTALYRTPALWPDDQAPEYIGLTAYYGDVERVFKVEPVQVEFAPVDNSDELLEAVQ